MQASAEPKSAAQPVDRFVWFPAQVAPLPELPNPRLAGRRIVVAGGREETAAPIAAVLRAQGAVALRYTGGEDAAEIHRRLGTVDGIVDLNLDGALGTGPADWEEALLRSVTLIRAYYQEWQLEANAERLFYVAVTRMGGTMGYGGDDMAQPLGGIWAGLAKTLPREIPNCNARVLDLAPQDAARAGELIARELYCWGLFEIGYRDGVRYSLCARREDAGRPDICLSADDVVLLSGGARGIGFALAKELARSYGCRIVVTGRTTVPGAHERWVRMDELEFKQYRLDLMKDAAAAKGLVLARKNIEQIQKRRDLFQHLIKVRAERLPIEYRECDITCRENVGGLIRSLGQGLSVVIHNAGVDAPVRLPGKSDESFLAVVRTKIGGFFNLVEALKGKHLKMFCNVGSLTGRWGGMVGETDYAAANEGLSRLGMWAGARLPFPVKTICWPTWERLGMIKNFDTAVTYSSALDIAEGTGKWKRELVNGRSGEVMFMGALGNGVSPQYLKGFPPIPDAANIGALYTQYHYLGEVKEFKPFQEMRSSIRIPASAPLMQEFRVDGVRALPLSILFDYGISAGDWIQPAGARELALLEVRDIRIDLEGLKVNGPACELTRHARGSWDGKVWKVEVEFSSEASAGAMAKLTLRYGCDSEALAPLPEIEESASAVEVKPPARMEWAGIQMKIARWRQQGETRQAEIASCPVVDLWSTTYVPRAFVPHAAIENIVRAAAALGGDNCQHLEIARLRLGQATDAVRLKILQSSGTWSIADWKNQVIAAAEGVACSS